MIHLVAVMLILASLDQAKSDPKVSGWDDEDWIAADTITNNYGASDYYNQTGNVDSAGIQFKTDSVLGENDHINIYFLNKDDKETGMFYIQFNDRMVIHPNGCLASGTLKLSAAIPSENEKIWTVSFNDELRLTIDVNGVILYNVLMSECTSQSWANNWKIGTVSIDIESRDSKAIVLDGYRAFSKDEDCVAGESLDQSTGCQPCPADEWSLAANAASTCTACPAGKGVAAGSGTSQSACTWKDCVAGESLDQSTGCQPCPADEWSLAANAASTCTACPAGKGVVAGSGTSQSACTWKDDDTKTNNEENHNLSDAGYSMTISTILFGTLLCAINMIY